MIAPIPPAGYKHPALYLVFRDVRTLACWSMAASLLANFLPDERRLARYPRARHAYNWFIDVVALVALNFRVCLPSLQQEFLGFKRKVKRRVRRWSEE